MSDHRETIRRLFDEVVNNGKIEATEELLDPEFQSRTPQATLDREGFGDYVRMWRAAFPDLHGEVDDVVVDGDKVAWSVRAPGTHPGEFMGIPPTGNRVDFDSLNIARLREGRVWRHRVMMDIPTMMGQLGVGPGQG